MEKEISPHAVLEVDLPKNFLVDFLERRISVVITGKDNQPESYVGILKQVTDDWVLLDFEEINPSFFLTNILFRPHQVRSVWVYKNRNQKDDKPHSKTATDVCRKLAREA